MVSFVVKGHLLGAARLSSCFVNLCRNYPLCNIHVVINQKEKEFEGIDGIGLNQWLEVFYEMERNPFNVLQIRIYGEKEADLSTQMIMTLWNWHVGDTMFMVILPSKALGESIMNGETTNTNMYDDSFLYHIKNEFISFTHNATNSCDSRKMNCLLNIFKKRNN